MSQIYRIQKRRASLNAIKSMYIKNVTAYGVPKDQIINRAKWTISPVALLLESKYIEFFLKFVSLMDITTSQKCVRLQGMGERWKKAEAALHS